VGTQGPEASQKTNVGQKDQEEKPKKPKPIPAGEFYSREMDDATRSQWIIAQSERPGGVNSEQLAWAQGKSRSSNQTASYLSEIGQQGFQSQEEVEAWNDIQASKKRQKEAERRGRDYGLFGNVSDALSSVSRELTSTVETAGQNLTDGTQARLDRATEALSGGGAPQASPDSAEALSNPVKNLERIIGMMGLFIDQFGQHVKEKSSINLTVNGQERGTMEAWQTT